MTIGTLNPLAFLGRAFLASTWMALPLAVSSAAQCPLDDATTTNNDCATAAPGVLGLTQGLSVQDTAEDYWTYGVGVGERITLTTTMVQGQGDLDLELFAGPGTCAVAVDGAGTTGLSEVVTVVNISPMPLTVTLRVFLSSGACADYELEATIESVSPKSCATAPDDAEEENDDCLSAVVPSANSLVDLYVSKTDEDWYSYTVGASESLTVEVPHLNSNGDIDLELYAQDCATVLDTSATTGDLEVVNWTNTTGSPVTVILRVFVWAGDFSNCNEDYGLDSSLVGDPCSIVPDDGFEENDDCMSAAPVTEGTEVDLFVRKQIEDSDWYTIDVPPQATLTVDVLFVDANGDIDITLFDGSSCPGTALDSSATVTDNEQVTWTNTSAATVPATWEVYVWQGAALDCNNYSMVVGLTGGGSPNLTPYCFGDGSGTPCPCGNNSNAGHAGGCANSQGNGAVLVGNGFPSVGADTLNFDIFSAGIGTFALLVSGDNQRPQVGGCLGCGVQAFDGLACAGGQMVRHGTRATDFKGDTGGGWGPPSDPLGGLIAANGFVAGQTRNFFVYYRDDVGAVCGFGQNSSNGISVEFQP